MTEIRRLAFLKEQQNGQSNRLIIEFYEYVSAQWVTYTMNQQTLNKYNTAEELKAALDDWMMKTYGYTMNDVWFHLNRDGSWAVAVGIVPDIWPEDIPPRPMP